MKPKFRAWDKTTKSMREVSYIYFDGKAIGLKDIETDRYIRDVVLMQFTGLQDKNGKTYYEGDLVRFDEEVFQVKFDKYQFLLEGFYEPRQDVPHDFFSEGAYRDAEIIGNIYENTELLEG